MSFLSGVTSQVAVLFRLVLMDLRDWVLRVVAMVLVAVVAELVLLIFAARERYSKSKEGDCR